MNAPLEFHDPDHGYRYRNLSAESNSDELLILLAFSGGGGRASALSYGVLRQLRDTEIEVSGERVRMLDEVDVISAVSGGSFTAAYYAAHGDAIFDSYEDVFLRRNFQGKIVRSALSPLQWPRLLSPWFSLTDRASEIYDAHLFHGMTYEDLVERGEKPFLIINATDITLGKPFQFTQDQFDFLHSDLSSVALARAVTASSAVPFLLDTIVLRNHEDRPDFTVPAWVEEGLALREYSSDNYQQARQMAVYADPETSPYVQLVDGGISDNLGVRSLLNPPHGAVNDMSVASMVDTDRVKRVAIIIVNAANQPDSMWPLHPTPPSKLGVLNAAISGLISSNTYAVSRMLRERLATVHEERGLEVSLIEVGFDSIEDEETRSFFRNVATSLALSSETYHRLIVEGARLLVQSPEYQRLVRELNGTIQPADTEE
jgi:NTE family protein